ncbi:DUF1850 domain-containing protein [Polymorphum gilvum]|uniref:Conserved domain protein n=1 Tax=Polymorphum gilvum (strain LMG 25793 / CGMCC 1.9160 / SL003B-26A1) TaxID=991905 RepID=F2IYR9_POLGS|nr:DUF1850 domain-containing protein [Polymorphum gilvum]ADZ69516.1 Conserved domain protein [Polymorphum gilvum SL003B-26A1]
MSLCLAVGAKALAVAAGFTLSWTHSVERTGWQERWSITPAGLVLEEARVRGSGAGMEPGDGAWLEEGWWVWQPDLPPQPRIVLAASGATGAGWTLCSAGDCHDIGAEAGAPVVIAPCPTDQPDRLPSR